MRRFVDHLGRLLRVREGEHARHSPARDRLLRLVSLAGIGQQLPSVPERVERAARPQVLVDLWHRGDRRGDRHHLGRDRSLAGRRHRARERRHRRAAGRGGLEPGAEHHGRPPRRRRVGAADFPPRDHRAAATVHRHARRDGDRARSRIHPHGGALLRRLAFTRARVAPARHPARLVAAGRHGRARARISARHAPVAMGTGGLLGRRQRDRGALSRASRWVVSRRRST